MYLHYFAGYHKLAAQTGHERRLFHITYAKRAACHVVLHDGAFDIIRCFLMHMEFSLLLTLY